MDMISSTSIWEIFDSPNTCTDLGPREIVDIIPSELPLILRLTDISVLMRRHLHGIYHIGN
jgi:hypothetical protein